MQREDGETERGTREGAREDGDGYAHPNIRVSRNTKVVVVVVVEL